MYLPPEVCIVVPGQTSKSKLNGPQTQQMIRYAVRKPWENANSILHEGVQTVGLDERTNQLLVLLIPELFAVHHLIDYRLHLDSRSYPA